MVTSPGTPTTNRITCQFSRREFDKIEIAINNELGQSMPFEYGKSVVKTFSFFTFAGNTANCGRSLFSDASVGQFCCLRSEQ